MHQQIKWDFDFDTDFKFNHIADNRIFMQCTGLKDKNGKLIYEGDIVKRFCVSSTMQPSIFIGVVSYDNKKGRWEIEKNGKSDWFYEDDLHEILGNVYENKELLDD